MILKEHQDFARELVALARKHGMTNLNMTFRLDFVHTVKNPEGYIAPYNQDIRLQWSQGRHGAMNKIRLETGAAVEIPECEVQQTEGK